ncbi:glycosyltransferase family 32 protein [Paratractidigestivibacter sp.]|uniref:glycosyltransferase family 32 protein n=1 Tax=Paratractidigestivibacter sp. TaxID=2847316 RepID=UPI002AC90BA9|nr:glycosyltransferase [Paratractidigestivibacter sp.]
MNQVIHYCWFGGNPLGDKELACIESWKKYFPGYEIYRWDESNFDVRCCDYVSEAYDAGKWAFVSDFARFAILYEHGGLYFDTDVEVIKSFDDILSRGPFMGFETDPVLGAVGSVAPGLGLAANPGLGLYATILDSYKKDHFVKQDGKYNFRTVVERVTDILLAEGLNGQPGIQTVCGINIYPSSYFNPTNLETGEVYLKDETHSIHHYDASWQPESLRRVGAIKQVLNRRLPWLPGKLRSFFAWVVYMLTTRDFKSFRDRY